MGQQLQTQLTTKSSSIEVESKNQSSDRSHIDLVQSFQIDLKSSNRSSQNNIQQSFEHDKQATETKESLHRVEVLLQFIGEIIYYCKLHMKKQHKYHYKISALLFYKYFYDKFRQLQSRYLSLYQKREILREEYEKKVALVILIKDTFIKIKKWMHKKLPFLGEKIMSFLDQNSNEYCFYKKQFFTQLLYPQVKEVMELYEQKTQGEFDEAGINACYVRMLKAILIIEELEYGNVMITMKDKDGMPDYEIDKVEAGKQQEVRNMLIESYKIFMNMMRSRN